MVTAACTVSQYAAVIVMKDVQLLCKLLNNANCIYCTQSACVICAFVLITEIGYKAFLFYFRSYLYKYDNDMNVTSNWLTM